MNQVQGQGGRKDQLVGQVVGNYQLVRRISAGGMGMVYQAQHTMLGTPVAVKLLFPHLATDREMVERLRREARAAAMLRHENVVLVTDFGYEEPYGFYLVMELLEGRELGEAIYREAPFSPERAWCICRQIGQAFRVAHQLNIVHRDLKPENVFLLPSEREERVKVLDFGIAHLREEKERLTVAGEVLGSPSYMSPEQARGLEQLDHRTDIYSLGILLFEMLSGRTPFVSKKATELIRMHVEEPPPLLGSFRAEFAGHPIEALLQQLLAKDPAQRPQTMDEVLAGLEEALYPTASAARPAPQVSPQVEELLLGLGQEDSTVLLPKDRPPPPAPPARLSLSERQLLAETKALPQEEPLSLPGGPSRQLSRQQASLREELAGYDLDAASDTVPRIRPSALEGAPRRQWGGWENFFSEKWLLLSSLLFAVTVVALVVVLILRGRPSSPGATALDKVQLHIVTTPPGSRLLVDNIFVGVTPYSIRVRRDEKVYLQLEHKQYQTVQWSQVVRRSRTIRIHLQPLVQNLRLPPLRRR